MKNHFRPFWLLLFLLNYSEAWPDLRSDEDYQTKTSLNQPVQEPDEEPSSHEIDQTLQHLARAGNMRNSAGWLRRPRPAVRMGEEEPEGEEQQEQKEVPEDGVANGRLKKNGRKEERGEGSREKAEEEDVAEEVEDNDEGDLEQQKDYDYGEMPAKSEEDRGEDPLGSSRGDKGGRHGGDAPPSFEETEQGQHDGKGENGEEAGGRMGKVGNDKIQRLFAPAPAPVNGENMPEDGPKLENYESPGPENEFPEDEFELSEENGNASTTTLGPSERAGEVENIGQSHGVEDPRDEMEEENEQQTTAVTALPDGGESALVTQLPTSPSSSLTPPMGTLLSSESSTVATIPSGSQVEETGEDAVEDDGDEVKSSSADNTATTENPHLSTMTAAGNAVEEKGEDEEEDDGNEEGMSTQIPPPITLPNVPGTMIPGKEEVGEDEEDENDNVEGMTTQIPPPITFPNTPGTMIPGKEEVGEDEEEDDGNEEGMSTQIPPPITLPNVPGTINPVGKDEVGEDEENENDSEGMTTQIPPSIIAPENVNGEDDNEESITFNTQTTHFPPLTGSAMETSSLKQGRGKEVGGNEENGTGSTEEIQDGIAASTSTGIPFPSKIMSMSTPATPTHGAMEELGEDEDEDDAVEGELSSTRATSSQPHVELLQTSTPALPIKATTQSPNGPSEELGGDELEEEENDETENTQMLQESTTKASPIETEEIADDELEESDENANATEAITQSPSGKGRQQSGAPKPKPITPQTTPPPHGGPTKSSKNDSKAHNAEEESREEANNDRHSAEDTAKPPREGEEEEGGSETRTPGAEESSAEKVPEGGEGNPEQPAEQGEPKSGNGESRNNGNEGNPIGQFGPIPGQVSPNGDAGPFIPYDPGSPIGPNGQIVPNGFGPYPNQQSGPNGQQQIGPRPYNPNGPNGGAGIPSGPFNPNGQNIGIPPDSNPNGPFPPSGQPGPTGQEAINKGENTDNQVNHGNEIGEKGVGEAQGTTNGYGESEQSDQIRGGQDVTAPSVTASSTVSSSPDLTTPSPVIAPPTASPTGVGGNGTLLSPNCANNPGQWSEWRETGACTAECGACGLMQRTRDCLSFQEGRGCPCLGEYKITEACNIGVCQYPQPSCCMPYNLIYLEGKFACGPQQDELLKRFLEESNGNKAAERPKLKDRVSRNLFFRRKK